MGMTDLCSEVASAARKAFDESFAEGKRMGVLQFCYSELVHFARACASSDERSIRTSPFLSLGLRVVTSCDWSKNSFFHMNRWIQGINDCG